MNVYEWEPLVIEYALRLFATVAGDVWTTVVHNWPFLLASVIVASIVQVWLDPERLSGWLRRRIGVAVVAAVALGALTPFCSCGTTAVVLGAMASSVPWAPIVAFMVSSPLASPEEYVLSIGLFGPSFAATFFAASIVAGLAGGAIAWQLESRGLLAGQARMAAASADRSDHTSASNPPKGSCASGSCGGAGQPDQAQMADTARRGAVRTLPLVAAPAAAATPSKLRQFLIALRTNSLRLTAYFLGFATLGYLIIRIIPTGLITGWLGAGNPVWSVPLAAVLGIPVYLNTDASLPLVASLTHAGMAPGAALAFLITGAGTSIGAISGMLLIARWRIVALVIGTLLLTAVVTGWTAGLWLG